jgi:hypothetical protein
MKLKKNNELKKNLKKKPELTSQTHNSGYKTEITLWKTNQLKKDKIEITSWKVNRLKNNSIKKNIKNNPSQSTKLMTSH